MKSQFYTSLIIYSENIYIKLVLQNNDSNKIIIWIVIYRHTKLVTNIFLQNVDYILTSDITHFGLKLITILCLNVNQVVC